MSKSKINSKMGIKSSILQEKLNYLQEMADSLLCIGEYNEDVYTNDFSLLNHKIHKEINDLFPLKGDTDEQEAMLCLTLLMGYSVSMYANSEDEVKKQTVLRRSQKVMANLMPSPLKNQLHNIYDKLLS